ncbi:MAG: transporter substrate-binding domain-containing protein [Aliarcobacter sp.]
MKILFIFLFFTISNLFLIADDEEIKLTQEEKIFLLENQPLRFHNEQYWPPYNFNENNTPKGFIIDYANLLAKKLNIKIEYISGPSWDEFMQMLRNDKIDAILNISKNKEREEYFNFTTPFHSASNAIYVKKGNEHLDSLKKLEGKTIVMPKGFLAQQYLEKNYPKINQILVKDSYEALKLLSLGKADATIDKKNVLDFIISTKNISEVVPSNYVEEEKLISLISIGTSKNKPLLNSILNKAQNSISETELLDLKRKWFGTADIKDKKSFLTIDEKEYINKKRVIKVCTITDLKPIEFYEEEKIQGINIDLLNLISKKLDIKFEYIKYYNSRIAENSLRNGTCDIFPTTNQTKNLKEIALFTKYITNYKLAIVTQKNKPVAESIEEILDKTMAKKVNWDNLNYLKSKYPSIDIYETSSEFETLEAVNNNKVYYAIEPLPVIAYYSSKYAFNDLFISRYTDMYLSSNIAVLKENFVLYEILNKTINEITEYEKTNIFNKWTNSFIKEPFDYSTLWKVLTVIFILLSILTYRQIILNRHNKALKIANNEIEEKTKLIAKQKELFEKLYSKSSDGVLLIKNKKISDCNEAILKLLEYSKDELLNKSLDEISPKFQSNNNSTIISNKKIDETLENGVCNFEWIFLTKNSICIWVEIVLTAIEIDNNAVIHAVIRNINKRKEMEKEIESLNNKLEDRILEEIKKNEEKTKQLIQQSRLAQMGEMISMIAHQWRQPLAAISATTNNILLKTMLNEKIPMEELSKELNLITDYSQHLSHTIDDFRNFFKTDKIKTEISLEELIDKTINIIKIQFETEEIKVEKNYKFNEKILSYSTELQQVILILLKNAEDALVEKEIKNKRIKISTHKENDFVIIEVEDNAKGIPNNIIDKIFDPYFSTKKEKEGTGIGLYMSKIIIDEHCNGNLSVKNSKFGAIFKIKLPLNI